MKCVCCDNDKIESFIDIKYSSMGSMNYPKEMNDSLIKYCEKCYFSFCYPFIPNDRLNLYYEKYYNGKSVKSDSHLSNPLISNLFFDERSISQISLINQFIDLDNTSILDIGSGSALFFLQLNRIGFKSTKKYVLEPQVKNIEWYNQNSIKVIDEDIFKIGKKYHNYFDFIIMSHSLEHFNSKDVNLILNNIYNLLKKNGLLFIEVPNADLKEYSNAHENMQPHLSFFSKKSLSMLFKKKNFNILFTGLFGESQTQKKLFLTKQKFYLNENNIYIHLDSEKKSKNTIKIRNLVNTFLNLVSLIFTKKMIIFIKDFYNIFIKKKSVKMNKREFKRNNIDGEFIRIIGEKLDV